MTTYLAFRKNSDSLMAWLTRLWTGSKYSHVEGNEGTAMGVFDGIIQEIDARGTLVRGKITLTAGGREIDCVFRRDDIASLRDSFDRRARVEAIAHYDGVSLLPVRLDVKAIKIIKTNPDLVGWRGKLKRPSQPSEWRQ